MRPIYVENELECELCDIIDSVIMDAKTKKDRKNKIDILEVGSGFDIETSKIPYKDFTLSYCYHWQFGFGEYAIMGRSLETMREFFLLLMDRMSDLKPKCRILVLDANLGYEWQFCKRYWVKLGITKFFAKEVRNPLEIEIGETIIFREVLGLFGRSLAQIAKTYCGMEKLTGDLDYEKCILSETEMSDKEIGYCIRDVEILVKLAEQHIFKTYYGKNSSLPYTATGIVRNEIKKAMGSDLKKEREKIKSLMPDGDDYELFRTYLFKGGISGSNILKMDKVYENRIIGADITSDYPFQMLTKKFPVGKAYRSEPTKFMSNNNPWIGWIRFHKFRSSSSHALMSCHKALNTKEVRTNPQTILDNNRIQYCEFVELLVNDVEYKSLKKAYKWEHETIKFCWEFKDGYDMLPFHIRKTVIKWYLKKENLKAEYSDTIEYKDAKAFVNSIFGMMCTALYMEDYVLEENGDVKGECNKTYEECCEYLFLSPYWGFWITSYAREMLMDVITRFPTCIIQYDTDSVYFDIESKGADKLISYLEIFNKMTRIKNDARFNHEEHMLSIGTWDFTKKFKRFKALGAKRYMYEKQDGEINVVISGCRKSKKEETKDISTLILQNEYNNKVNHENVDVFDFFNDRMVIDKEHSEKLASKYVDDYYGFRTHDYLGNEEFIEIPSCVALVPIPFEMRLGRKHKDLLIAVKRYAENTGSRKVYDIWRELNGR